jgi:S1-C subfamily serine protease
MADERSKLWQRPVHGKKVSEVSESDGDQMTSPEPEAWPGFNAGFPAPPGHQHAAPTPPPRRPRRGRVVLAALMAGLMLLSGGVGLWWGINRDRSSVSSTSQQEPIGSSPNGTGRSAADAVEPAIVDITTYVRANPLGAGSSGDDGALVPEGAGTGMVLSSTGEVLTNNHVIKGASSIKITISGRSGSYTAAVVGADPTDDVALLQIQGVSGLPTVTVADSSALSVGQQVVAIGNAFGRGGAPTVTNGTVSALHRDITVADERGGSERLSDLIQTDAPIRPGDSGGPLVDANGRVIGMITAGARGAFDRPTPNVGYAIPMNVALGVVNQIRAGNASATIILGTPGYIGVQVRNLDDTTASRLKVTSGALVVGVQAGSPAAGAGISPGAAITAIDGHAIGSADALGPVIHAHGPGDQIQVTWVDANGTHTATMTLVPGPAV